MKLSPRTYKIEWDLHAWCGVFASILLFVIFYCGVFALFRGPLGVWQRPLTADVVTTASPQAVFEAVQARAKPPQGAHIDIWWSAEDREATAIVSHAPTKLREELHVDGAGQRIAPEYSRLARELYLMHFLYRAPGGTELAGLAAVALFVALISGLVIHWKDLWRQWWRFRPKLRLRFSASDAHKVLGIFGLPFGAMFAWSGAILGLWSLLAAPVVAGAFHGDAQAFEAAQGYGAQPAVIAPERPVQRLAVNLLVERAAGAAAAHYGSMIALMPEHIEISSSGASTSHLTATFARDGFQAERRVELDATTGRILSFAAPAAPGKAINQVFFDLHYALFGGFMIKVFYALLALGVCAVVLTGNLVWLERRDEARANVGNRLLERLTVGVPFGLVLGTAVYFAANRTLPAALARRADLEFALFVAAWAISAALSCYRLPAKAWARYLSGLAAVLFGSVVLTDLIARTTAVLGPLAQIEQLEADALISFLALVTGSISAKLGSKSEAATYAANKIRPPVAS